LVFSSAEIEAYIEQHTDKEILLLWKQE